MGYAPKVRQHYFRAWFYLTIRSRVWINLFKNLLKDYFLTTKKLFSIPSLIQNSDFSLKTLRQQRLISVLNNSTSHERI